MSQDDAPSGRSAAAGTPPSRSGKVQIATYAPPETRKRLKILAAREDRSIESLLTEAIDDLFTKYSA